ncbi:MAG: type 4a pilus biogenesis protein PilO [Candidatus Omnitrophota bacterium]
MDKRKILMPAVFIAIIGLFLQFMYFPKIGQARELSLEYRKIRTEINELYNFIGGEEKLKDSMIIMRNHVAELEQAFPSEKEASNTIKQLNEKAVKFKVNVISMKPGDLINYTDVHGSQLKILDQPCKSMPINLSLEARYQSIGDFLEKIELDKKPLISVMRIEMRKDQNLSPKIKAEVGLNACILGE